MIHEGITCMNEKDKIIEQINIYYEFWFRVNDVYRVWAQNHNTNETTVFVLYVINTSTPYCTQIEIGNKLLLPKQTVSLVLSGLEKKGFIFSPQYLFYTLYICKNRSGRVFLAICHLH